MEDICQQKDIFMAVSVKLNSRGAHVTTSLCWRQVSKSALSSTLSGLYVSVFLFALSFADHFLLFTNQISRHNISSKCQNYTTDLITCHWHHTSLCKLLIQSNTVPNVNREGKKKIKAIPQQGKDGRAGKRKTNIFTENEWFLCYLNSKKRQN